MQTKLSRICDAIMEAGWLAAVVVAPLFFNTTSNRIFEPDKIHLVRSIALIMTVAWLIQLLDGGAQRTPGASVWQTLRNTPLVLPALVLVLSYLLSTALSVVPRISLLGSYVRMQGTLSFLSYVAIGAMVLTHLRRRSQVNRLFSTIILTSLPIALYGVVQQAGLDPLPWGGDVRDRVAANMGNAIFVGAYLIMAMFLTLERLLTSLSVLQRIERAGLGEMLRPAVYLFVFAVQIATLVFTQSRGPQFAFLAGLYVFLMLGVLLLARWTAGRVQAPRALRFLAERVRAVWVGLLGFALGFVTLVLVMNIPGGPLQGLCEIRYLSRTCTAVNVTEGTNAVRALIWEGVVDLVFRPHAPLEWPDGRRDTLNPIRPLIGYGPESMWVTYNRFYPAELANIESRNASPDRSHNETFDALVRGGLIQFAAQVWLFASVFFYGLRWLGVLQGRRRRNAFIGFLFVGGITGVLVPLVADGSLRLAGIGLPLGLIAGMMAYVTFDLLSSRDPLHGAAFQGATASERERQVLVLAILAGVVAHFVEVHLGIAIVSTMTHFWVLAAAMVVIGAGWVRDDASESLAAERTAVADRTAEVRQAVRTQPARASQARKGKTGAGQQLRGASQSNRPATEQAAATRSRSPILALLPYAATGALISIVLAWNYAVNQSGSEGALAIFWNAFTARVEDFRLVRSPMLLVLVLFTWLCGAMLSVAGAREDEGGADLSWGKGLLTYLVVVVLAFLIFGLLYTSRQGFGNLDGLDIFHRRAQHIVVFDAVVLLLILLAAAAIASVRPWPAQGTRRGTGLVAPVGLGLVILGGLLAANLNVKTVQADTYFKAGTAYEDGNDWQSAVVVYREAARRQPQEDYFYLFLGRGLLQLSDMVQPGTATLPTNLDNVGTGDLLTVIDRGLRAGSQEDILRSAHAALVAAQRLNPLNTDHAANLARLSRAWAFTGAVPGGDLGDPSRLHEVLETNPAAVNQERLNRAVDHYREAVALSPSNAGLWNELATTQYILGDLGGAEASLQRSLAVDARYYPTYLLLGQVRLATGDRAGALAAYREATARGPNDVNVLSSVALASAGAGDVDGAVKAFERIAILEMQRLSQAETQLRALDAEAAAAGGYDRLQGNAAGRRQQLEAQIGRGRSQVYLTQRNIALVYRDAGQRSEARAAAQQALAYATDEQRAEIELLIAELQG
jgi:tetratricopeptide (TPR) repeat protein